MDPSPSSSDPSTVIFQSGPAYSSAEGTEKENLLTQLREDLEATSRRNMLERQKEEAEFMNETLNRIPYPIYIG